jgi:hypothetical protein
VTRRGTATGDWICELVPAAQPPAPAASSRANVAARVRTAAGALSHSVEGTWRGYSAAAARWERQQRRAGWQQRQEGWKRRLLGGHTRSDMIPARASCAHDGERVDGSEHANVIPHAYVRTTARVRQGGSEIPHLFNGVVGGGVGLALEVNRRSVERTCGVLLCVMIAQARGTALERYLRPPLARGPEQRHAAEATAFGHASGSIRAPTASHRRHARRTASRRGVQQLRRRSQPALRRHLHSRLLLEHRRQDDDYPVPSGAYIPRTHM